jgi:hypothetical protein
VLLDTPNIQEHSELVILPPKVDDIQEHLDPIILDPPQQVLHIILLQIPPNITELNTLLFVALAISITFDSPPKIKLFEELQQIVLPLAEIIETPELLALVELLKDDIIEVAQLGLATVPKMLEQTEEIIEVILDEHISDVLVAPIIDRLLPENAAHSDAISVDKLDPTIIEAVDDIIVKLLVDSNLLLFDDIIAL